MYRPCVVVNENTLGYTDPRVPWFLGILAGNIWRGGPDPMRGWTVIGCLDVVRPATAADFAEYRVSSRYHLPD